MTPLASRLVRHVLIFTAVLLVLVLGLRRWLGGRAGQKMNQALARAEEHWGATGEDSAPPAHAAVVVVGDRGFDRVFQQPLDLVETVGQKSHVVFGGNINAVTRVEFLQRAKPVRIEHHKLPEIELVEQFLVGLDQLLEQSLLAEQPIAVAQGPLLLAQHAEANAKLGEDPSKRPADRLVPRIIGRIAAHEP